MIKIQQQSISPVNSIVLKVLRIMCVCVCVRHFEAINKQLKWLNRLLSRKVTLTKQQRTTWLCNLCEPFLNFDPRISHQIKSKSKIRHNNISFGQSRKHTSGDDSFYRRFQRWEIRKHQTKQNKKLHAHLSSAKFKYTTFCSPVSTCLRATTKNVYCLILRTLSVYVFTCAWTSFSCSCLWTLSLSLVNNEHLCAVKFWWTTLVSVLQGMSVFRAEYSTTNFKQLKCPQKWTEY